MCLPLIALGVAAAGVGLQAYGMSQNAKANKAQATANAAQQELQAQLANYNADQTEKFGALNADLTLKVSNLNTAITQSIADVNVSLINSTTDFNVGILKATTDFNVSSAEGAARLLEARGDMEAAAHNANADYLEIQAQDSLEAGKQAEGQSRTAYSLLKGQQRARLAANGVTLDEGSSLRIQADTEYASDVDADTIRSNAIKAAMGYRVSAVNERTSAAFASLDASAQAMDKRAEAVAARINGSVGIAQAQLEGGIKALDTKMTASFQIVQDQMNAKIEAMNIINQSKSDAWAMRASALGYQGAAAQSRATAKAINPALAAGTALTAGLGNLAFQAYQMNQAGAFTAKKAG